MEKDLPPPVKRDDDSDYDDDDDDDEEDEDVNKPRRQVVNRLKDGGIFY